MASQANSSDVPSFLDRPEGGRIAYHLSPARRTSLPGLIFLGGFMSDMTGTKATALEGHALSRGQGFLRFDYRGHGQSSDRFEDVTIDRRPWRFAGGSECLTAAWSSRVDLASNTAFRLHSAEHDL